MSLIDKRGVKWQGRGSVSWTVIKYAHQDDNGQNVWLCQGSNGHKKTMRWYNIKKHIRAEKKRYETSNVTRSINA
jgi:hypothetical protein